MKHLIDCYIETFAYVTWLINSKTNNDDIKFEQVQTDLDRLLKKGDQCAVESGFPPEDIELAKFAICAWADEKILASQWPHKGHWQREQLQRRHFNTTSAGEIFFEKMNMLGPHQRDVREIYYFCLCLGFMGKYCHEGEDYLLEQLKLSNLKLLTGSSLAVPSLENERLFPEAYSAIQDFQADTRRKKFSMGLLVGILSPVLLFGLLFAVYSFILQGVGNNILNLMP